MKDLMDSLYQRAEATLRQRTHQSPGQFAALSPVEAQRMLHDLQVHQVELDLQNEDLRCAHLALHAAQVDYFDFYDLAPVGYLSVCKNGLISQANLTAANLLGQPRNQLIHQPISHLVFKDDHHIYYAFRQRLLTDGQAPPCELRLLKLDSQPFWARLAAVLAHDDKGMPMLRFVISDITEGKQAEVALQKSEERLQLVLRGSRDAPWDWNLENDTLYYSPQWWVLIGHAVDELTPNPALWLELMHPDDRLATHEFFEGVLKSGPDNYECEFRLRHKDGHYVPQLSRGFIRRDPSGRPVRVSGVNTDLTERKRLEGQVHQLAFYDPLTHLPNRRMMGERLSHTMALSKRSGRYAAVMVLDLDNFKQLNDTRGHLVGDLLLVEVASRLLSCVRAVDTVARFGGDEFVVVLGELDLDKTESRAQAQMIAEKIRAALSSPYVLTHRSDDGTDITVEHHCSASIGVVLFVNHETPHADILRWADAAMYQAKDAGRNTIRFYEANDENSRN